MNELQRFITSVDEQPPRQVPRLPALVDKTATQIEGTFEQTAQALEATAVKLRDRAEDLDKKAIWLRSQTPLAEELRAAVATERSYYEEVISLALVDVGVRSEL